MHGEQLYLNLQENSYDYLLIITSDSVFRWFSCVSIRVLSKESRYFILFDIGGGVSLVLKKGLWPCSVVEEELVLAKSELADVDHREISSLTNQTKD